MTAAVLSDRSVTQQFAAALGRLRMLVRQQPVPAEFAMAQARACGQQAYAAGHSLELVVDLLAGIVPADAYRDRTLATDLGEAAASAYLTEADRRPDLLAS